MLNRATAFLREYAAWSAAGWPVRSAQRIAELFAVCQACEHFESTGQDRGRCRLCTCHVSTASGELNKLFWATTVCPADPPRWAAEGDDDSLERIDVSIPLSAAVAPTPPDVGCCVRPAADVSRIYKEHCAVCPQRVPNIYRDDEGICRLCGCLVSSRPDDDNKIARAASKCPDDPPRWS